jgi:predicted acetyltransferase
MGDIHSHTGLNLSIEVTKDKDLVRSIITNKEIMDGFCSEESIDRYVESLGEEHICYLLKCKEDICGIAVILSVPDDIIEGNVSIADIGFYKRFRGSVAIALARLALEKFFKENQCKQLMAVINKNNKAALLNAKWLGFEISSLGKYKYYLRYKKDGRINRRL